MKEILEASVIYRFFALIYGWFSAQWQQSRLVNAFLSPGNGQAVAESSIFYKLWRWLHRGVCALFAKVRLTRLLEGSMFKQMFFWAVIAAALAPLIPTMVLLAIVSVAFFSFFVSFACDDQRLPIYAPVNRYILLFALIYAMATFTSVTLSGSLFGGMLTIVFIGFTLVFENAIVTQKQLDLAVVFIVCAGVLVALYGLYQYVFHISDANTWVDNDMFSEIALRVYATLENPNVLAEYLLLVIPFAFAGVLTGETLGRKFLYLLSLGLLCLCMILTFSRGGWLGLLFAATVFLVLLDRRFILLGLVGLIALYFILPDTIIDRFTSIGNLKDTSTSYRVFIWMATINMLKEYWLCGIGPGTDAFNEVYPAFAYNSIAAPHSHNLFLQIMCDAGCCGLIVFLIFIGLYYKMMCGALSREKKRTSRILQIASISAMSGFLLQGMTDYSFYNYRVMFFFWAFVALSVAIANRSQLGKGEK